MAIQFLNNQYISGTLEVAGATTFDTVANPGSDTDKFVVINGSGLLGFRTGAEILADIGAASSATSVTSVSGTQPIISSGGLTPTISLNYTGANNLIESATDLEGNSIATADSIIYNDATDGNVKKGLISDLPFSNTSGTVTSITPGADSGTGTAITTSGTITVAGGSNITTSVSGTTITVNTDFNQYGWSITDGSTTNSIPSGTTVTFQGGTGINTSLNGYILDIEIDSSVVPGGSGTAGKLTKWTATKTLGDGPVTISGSDATFDGHITLASDKKVNFGASSYIEGATSGSKLMFRSSDDMVFQPGNSTKVTFQANGNTTFAGNVDLDSDSTKLRLGDGQDLSIYYNGTNGFITYGTSGLYIQGDYPRIQSSGGENMIAANANAEVNLYFNNVNKLQTTSYGTNTSGRGTIVDTTNPGGDGTASGGGVLTVEGRRDGTANVLTLRARDESAPAVALPDGQGGIVRWQGFDGTDFAQMGAIAVVADGQAVANSDAPSKMVFYTTADGSETLTTALTLDKSQNATFAGTLGNKSNNYNYAIEIRWC